MCILLAVTGCSSHASETPNADRQLTSRVGDARQDDLAAFAESLGLSNPPSVQPIREISPEEEFQVISECMDLAGFPAEDDFGDSLDWDIPESQVESFSRARYTCQAQYPLAAEFDQPLDRDGLSSLYDYWMKETMPCLEDLGYTAAVPPPTKEAYLGGFLWEPREAVYAQVMADVDGGRWSGPGEVFGLLCPVDPPAQPTSP